MATISLYSRPELLRSGNQALRPAQFQLADSGLASGLGQIAKVSANFAADLNQKAKEAEDATTLINLDKKLSEKQLQLSKWQMENSNNDQITKNGVSLWEMKAREEYDNLLDEYNQIDMTPETRRRVNTIINHHANNAIMSSWSGGIKQIGNNFDTEFATLLNNVEQNGDGTIARLSIDTARSGGVINDSQSNARLQSVKLAENRYKLTSINKQAKMLIETAKFNPNNYEIVKGLYKNAFDNNLITEDEYKAQIADINYTFQYNDKLSALEIQIKKDAVSVDNKLNKNIKKSTLPIFRSAESTSVITGNATIFGLNRDGSIDKEDNGMGAFGYNTRDPELVGVSLPLKTLEKLFGKNYDSYVKKNKPLIEVTNPKTGKTIVAPIVDKGPAEWTGNAIDLTYAASKQLGGTGKDVMSFRLADDTSVGEYSWLSPVDYEKAKLTSSAAVVDQATKAFNTLTNAINIGQILPDELAVGTDAIPFSKAKSNPNYRALFESDDEDIQIMKKSIELYSNDKLRKMMINDDMLYEGVISLISSYDPTNDYNSKRYVALASRISTEFTGPKQKELQDRLDKQKQTGLDFQFNKTASDALSTLNKRAFEEEVFGKFRNLNLVEITDEDRVVSAEDIKANTLFDLPDPNNPGATIRRVPTQADVDAEVRTGKKRYVIPVKPNSVTYLKYKGEDSPPELVELKKEDWESAGVTPVYDEDSNEKTIVTDKVKAIRNILEKEIREGIIKNSEDAVKRMNELSKIYIKKSFSDNANKIPGNKSVGTTGISVPNPRETKSRLEEARLKAKLKTGS